MPSRTHPTVQVAITNSERTTLLNLEEVTDDFSKVDQSGRPSIWPCGDRPYSGFVSTSLRRSLLCPSNRYFFGLPLVPDCGPVESERSPQIPWHSRENVSRLLVSRRDFVTDASPLVLSYMGCTNVCWFKLLKPTRSEGQHMHKVCTMQPLVTTS